MTPAQIKLHRTESILEELIPEALSTMNDTRLHQGVIEVVVARGRSDAKVYLDPTYLHEEEKREILAQIKRARPVIEEYCMRDQGWHRCPKLSFEFDDSLQKIERVEELFKKIEKEIKRD